MIQPSTWVSTLTSSRQTVPPAPLKSFMKVSLDLLSTLLDHLPKNKLTLILGTFTVLHVLNLLSKWQTVGKEYKYREPHLQMKKLRQKNQFLPAPRMVRQSQSWDSPSLFPHPYAPSFWHPRGSLTGSTVSIRSSCLAVCRSANKV